MGDEFNQDLGHKNFKFHGASQVWIWNSKITREFDTSKGQIEFRHANLITSLSGSGRFSGMGYLWFAKAMNSIALKTVAAPIATSTAALDSDSS